MNGSANGDQQNDDVGHIIVELSNTIRREMRNNTWASRPSQAKTIFRVPKEQLQHAEERTYQPSFLSIGPYHHAAGIDATAEMQRNEQGKLWILNNSTSQYGDEKQSVLLEYIKAVQSMETKARSCYEGDIGMDRYEFCRMLLLDAFQLIQLLQLPSAEETAEAAGGAAATDASSSQGQDEGRNSIRTQDMSLTFLDLMMLENQIPFFVVEKMYELHYANAAPRTVRTLAWEAMKAILDGVPPAAPKDPRLLEFHFHHLVHVCHVYLKPTVLLNESTTTEVQ